MTATLHDVFDAIGQSNSVEQLRIVLEHAVQALNLRHLVYHSVGTLGVQEPSPLLILTYPKAWVERYFAAKYLQIDPVVNGGLRGLMPTDWSTLDRDSQKVRRFFDEAIEYGVGRQGVTMTIRGPGSQIALFTFTGEALPSDWPKVKAAMLPPMLLIAHAFHSRVIELTSPTILRRTPKLSPREVDCLQYCAKGLRDYETAQKLSISEAVVRAYVDSARHKLGSPTRPHMIATAIKLNIINLRD